MQPLEALGRELGANQRIADSGGSCRELRELTARSFAGELDFASVAVRFEQDSARCGKLTQSGDLHRAERDMHMDVRAVAGLGIRKAAD